MIAFHNRADAPDRRVTRIDLDRIQSASLRQRSDEAALRALAESIRRFGLLSPLLVRRAENGCFRLIAGERRLRALKLLGRDAADAIILDADGTESALIALIENLQREELHFLDEAEACRRILLRQQLTQQQLADALSKSPSALANLLRLLKLPKAVRMLVREKRLSERHARALLRLPNEAAQIEFAASAAEEGWSVRALEAEIERSLRPESAPQKTKKPITRLFRDNRLVLNALNDTVRQLKRIGVRLESRVEAREGEYDVIITVKAAQIDVSDPQSAPPPPTPAPAQAPAAD